MPYHRLRMVHTPYFCGHRHVNDPCSIGTKVRKAFGDWFKSHQDMWQLEFRSKFTEEELMVVEEVMYSPTYYA